MALLNSIGNQENRGIFILFWGYKSNDPILQKIFSKEQGLKFRLKKSFCFSNSPMLMLDFND